MNKQYVFVWVAFIFTFLVLGLHLLAVIIETRRIRRVLHKQSIPKSSYLNERSDGRQRLNNARQKRQRLDRRRQKFESMRRR